MLETLLIVCVVLLIAALVMLFMLLRRQVSVDLSTVSAALTDSHVRTERAVREEIAGNRNEMAAGARGTREELAATLKRLGDTLDARLGEVRNTVETRLATIQEDNGRRLDAVRTESLAGAQKAREEVNLSLSQYGDTMARALTDLAASQRTQLANVIDQVNKLTDANEKRMESQRLAIDERLKAIQADTATQLTGMRAESQTTSKQQRDETSATLKGFNESVVLAMGQMAEAQRTQIAAFAEQLGKLTDSNQQKLEALRQGVELKLGEIQQKNSEKLEQMRVTVDEKLQGTLEKRLGESFKLVSERLEAVAKGLGEMQVLASGVDDLRKVFSNVKNRGGWGEVQLGSMLEQVLTPEQYATNVATSKTGERVEFAIRMPGRGDDATDAVWMPIDSKFPLEDYQRLVQAQEAGDTEAAEQAARQLDIRIKACAADICRKYIAPPYTTDFAILFLPTEGLFAEVIRRTGLVDYVQRECRVVIAGPTTLWSLLNSLQMGFRTLAIQKRSGEVWTLLAAVKTEFSKYGEVMGRVQNKLQQASSEIDKVAVRSRAIDRKLRTIHELPIEQAGQVLMLEAEVEEPEPA